MKIQDQVITLEQAKRLKELGLNGEDSLVLYENHFGEPILLFRTGLSHPNIETYPAYTVAELGEMILERQSRIHSDSYCQLPFKQYYPHTNREEWKYNTPFTKFYRETKVLSVDTEAQARGALLIHLIENNQVIL